jgi:glycosyltransferase involved in cell wall biosynthesis
VRICFVGKYPPIQGGTSSESYWAVRGLAEAGHQVYVVTNAAEVEPAYRIELEPADAEHLEPTFAGGGAVRVFRPEHAGRRLSHIPMANPFVSKLAGLATQVVREFDCEVIVGSYYEPYGVAASLAANWTGTPILLQHAGSDLDRLMRVPELATVYREMLTAADGVITRPNLYARFVGLGVRPEALRPGPPFAMPPYFSPDAVAMTADEINRLAETAPGGPQPDRPFDAGVPTIGMYGKPGEFKGTYDLVAALGIVRAAGLDFNLLLLSGSSQDQRLTAAIEAAGIGDRTWRLPFVPHWRVAGFIRACTAVCFLERDFPVPIHGPVVPHEVLSTGTCLVLSGEIHGKQRGRDLLIDGDNLILVDDPKDRETLAKKIRAVIERPDLAAGIGSRGRLVAAEFAAYEEFVSAWEALLVSVVDKTGGPEARSLADALAAGVPWARSLLGGEFDGLVVEFGVEWGGGPVPDRGAELPAAAAFCSFLESRTTGGVRDAARYQRARLWAMRHDAEQTHLRPVGDVLRGRPLTLETIGDLYPFRGVPVRVERFEYDVTPLFCQSDGPAVTDAAALSREPLTIGFARLPNLAPAELRVNEATVGLLERCDGRMRTDELIEWLGGRYAKPPAARDIVATLGGLYASGVLAFTDAAIAAAPLTHGQ